MSISCTIAVEFHRAPSKMELNALSENISARLLKSDRTKPYKVEVDDTLLEYSGYSVDDNGVLCDDGPNGASSPAIGSGYSIKNGCLGKILTLGRFWSKDYPEGNMPEHVVILLTLLSQTLVKRCWYFPDDSHLPKALSKSDVHSMLDDFIEVGVN